MSSGKGYAMTWLLVLYFTCAAECGHPTHATLPGYASQEACNDAGSVWMSPAANPTQAVKGFAGPFWVVDANLAVMRGFGCYQRSTSPLSSYRD